MSATHDNAASSGHASGDVSEYSIEVGLDWGTCKWVAAYAVSRNGKHVNPPSPLKISDRGHEVPMKATWDGDRLVQGFDLEGLANRDVSISDKIIDHFKLSLYDGPDHAEVSSIKTRMDSILADIPGKNYDALITEHLQAIIPKIKESIRTSLWEAEYPKDKIDHMLKRVLVRITVPQMWRPSARRRMQDAAKKAGLDVVVLACEPQCALAYFVNRFSKRVRPFGQPLGKGKVIVVMDVGAGTGDFAAFTLLEQLGPSSRLEHIKQSSGELCGSFRVDQILYNTLKNTKGRAWLVKSASTLRVGERDFERRALEAIKEMKQNFTEADDSCTGVIKGIGTAAIVINFTREEMIHAFDQVIKTICDAMDSLISTRTPDFIQVTGGFARNWYLMQKLRQKYQGSNTVVERPHDTETEACFPVAVGSLLRYENITTQSLPSQYGYALLQDELYDKKLHTDSYGPSKPNGKKFQRKPWILPSSYNSNELLAIDRIRNIVPKGTILQPGERAREYQQTLDFFIPVNNPRISADFVYLDKEVENHSASRDHQKELDDLLPGQNLDMVKPQFCDGIHHWVSLSLSLEEEKAKLGVFDTIKTVNEEERYVLSARVVVRLVREDMQIEFEILKPPKDPKPQKSPKPTKRKGKAKKTKGRATESEGRAKEPEGEITQDDSGEGEHPDDVLFRVRDKVWDGAHSDFAQS